MELGWEGLDEIARNCGESYYLLDMTAFRRNYDAFLAAFRRSYPKTNLAYSYKTNYIPDLCTAVDARGGYAEVVSRMEYDLALAVGVDPARIIFNGPYKAPEDLQYALLGGSVVNLDSPYELDIVEDVARRHPEQALHLGIRCNFDLGTGHVSRFGFDVDDGGLARVLSRVRQLDNCVVDGLHCHFLVPQKAAAYYSVMADRMLELASSNFAHGALRFLDLGGGFFSRMSPELQRQFGHPVPAFADYAEAIAPRFARAYPAGDGPELLLEPGIALVADTMHFVARAFDAKAVRGRTIVLVAGSIYDIKPTLNSRNLPMEVVVKPGGNRDAVGGPLDVVGYTCMEHDCLFQGFEGEIAPGDFVRFSNVGAYTVVLNPPFINPCPAIVAYDGPSAPFRVVKRRESMADVFRAFTLGPSPNPR